MGSAISLTRRHRRRTHPRSADYAEAPTSSDPLIEPEWVLRVHKSDLGWRAARIVHQDDGILLLSGTKVLELPHAFVVEVVHRRKSGILALVRQVGQPIELVMPSDGDEAYEFKRWMLDRLIDKVAFVTRED